MAASTPAASNPYYRVISALHVGMALVLLTALIVATLWGVPPALTGAFAPTHAPLAQPDVYMTVPLTAPTIPSQVQLGTNITAPSEVSIATDPAHGALLQEWSPPMVRLHMGYTGNEIVLPDRTRGQWDFTKTDAAIERLRSTNTPFFLNIRTGPPWMYDDSGQLRDQTYQEFAQFMARLVGWYNKGGFTDELGHFHASGHQNWVKTWEIWNEPNAGYDIPAAVSQQSATWLIATSFARLYSVTSVAMRAVDSTIQTGGPTISSYPDDGYVVDFIQHVTAPLDFFSFHFYAIGNQHSPDADAFAAVAGKFAHRLTLARSTLDARFPGKAIPIWVDEVGYNEIARYPVDPRGAAPVGIAFDADTFIMAAQHGVVQFTQFPFLGNAQLALVDNKTYKPYLPLRFYETVAREFPAGMGLLPSRLSRSSGVVALAALDPDGGSLRVLIANLEVAQSTDVRGAGVPMTVRVTLGGRVVPARGGAVGWSFDATTDPNTVTPAHRFPLFVAENGEVSVQATLQGYGVAIIQIPLR